MSITGTIEECDRAKSSGQTVPDRRLRTGRTEKSATTGKNVLFVESGSGLGGSMRSLVVLLSGPEWKTWRAQVLLSRPDADTALLDEAGVPYGFLETPRFQKNASRFGRYPKMLWHLGKCLKTGFRIASLIRKRRIDMVHLNNEIFAGIPALFGAMIAGVPVTCHLRSQRKPTRVERTVSVFCERFVSISRTGARFFRNRLPVGRNRVISINNPFEIARDEPAQDIAKENTAFTVGMMSNYLPGKGHEYFIEAAAEIAGRFPGTRFLLMGGKLDNGDYLETLRRAAVGTGANVDFMPWRKDVSGMLKRLDVLVDCSYLDEGYRRTIIEGMLAGVPVVASDVGPAGEVISSRSTGMLVEPRNSKAIAGAVCALLGERALRERIIRNGRALAARRFSREESVADMQAVFCEAIRKKGDNSAKPSGQTKRLPNVLFVEAGGGYGGSIKCILALYKEHLWKDWRVEAAMTHPQADASLLDEMHIPNFLVDAPQFEDSGTRLGEYAKMVWYLVRCRRFGRRFAKELRSRRIDIIHHNNAIFAGLPIIFAAKIAGIPMTTHIRSQRPPTHVERIASLFLRRIVSHSRHGASFFRKRLPISGAKICFVNDPYEYRAVERAENTGHKNIGVISNFIPGKGHEYLISAAAEISRRFPNVRFLFAGRELAGHEGYLGRLKALAGKTGADIEFLPWQKDIPALLAKLDIVVDCSYLYEGYRRTIIEGLLAGCAMVVTDTGSARDIIVNRKTGMLVKPRSAQGLAAAVCVLLADGALREKIARQGRARAREVFSCERSVAAMQDIFMECARV